MVAKVNGKAMPDQFATGAMQYVEIDAKTALPLNVQANLDLLVQVISTRSQPLILGTPNGNVINVAFGHAEVWPLTDLAAALIAAGFTGATATVKVF